MTVQDRRGFIKLAVGGLAVAATSAGTSCTRHGLNDHVESPWDIASDIIARVKPPTYHEQDFDVLSYGAVGDGITDCSLSIEQAISECARTGGGRVVIPPGRFLTGPIRLQSRVNLHLMTGATLAFSSDPSRFLPQVLTRFNGIECWNLSPCIYAYEQSDIAVTGDGVLDGQAAIENWWSWKGVERFGWTPGTPNQEVALARLRKMAAQNVSVNDRIFGVADMLRPMFFQPYRCKNVLIDGVTILRTPSWAIHPVLCSNVTVRRVTVDSKGPNNDGCNPESCTDVLIEECTFDTGDDCIAIKSGLNNDGRRVGEATSNVVVRNCVMKNGHGAMTIGSEVSGGAHHIFFDRCILEGPNLGWAIRFKSNAQRGGTVEHVYCRDVTANAIRIAALSIDLQYDEGPEGDFPPVIRDVELATIRSKNVERVMEFRGISNSTVENVVLRNCTFEDVKKASAIENAQGVTLSDVRVNGRLVTTLSDLIF